MKESWLVSTIGAPIGVQCRHAKITRTFSVLYCSLLSIFFVGALYVLVPKEIRKLDRDHHLHIQRRALSSFIVCFGAILTYPLIFCEENALDSVLLFFHPRGAFGVLSHSVILYTGPIVASLLRLYEFNKISISRGKAPHELYPMHIIRYFGGSLKHLLNPSTKEAKWRNFRNFLAAPWTEEIVFRGCMVPSLLASGMSPLQVTFVCPLFFGFAHLHHAALRLSKGETLTRVIVGTTFQFAYTSLYGSYATHALIRSGSVTAVSLSHAYCNMMGLPDLSFLHKSSGLYKHRIILGLAYMIGIWGFKWFFSTNYLLPLPAKLIVSNTVL